MLSKAAKICSPRGRDYSGFYSGTQEKERTKNTHRAVWKMSGLAEGLKEANPEITSYSDTWRTVDVPRGQTLWLVSQGDPEGISSAVSSIPLQHQHSLAGILLFQDIIPL